MTRERLGEARQEVRDLAERVTPVRVPRRSARRAGDEAGVAVGTNEGPLQIGDTVLVLRFGQNAELVGLSADRSEAEVQMGSLRFRGSVDNLERLNKRQAGVGRRRQTQPAAAVARSR